MAEGAMLVEWIWWWSWVRRVRGRKGSELWGEDNCVVDGLVRILRAGKARKRDAM